MGLQINTPNCNVCVKVSAYADDITVILGSENDVQVLTDILKIYGNASTTKVNWVKSNALWCGSVSSSPGLQGWLQWGFSGLNYLGVF